MKIRNPFRRRSETSDNHFVAVWWDGNLIVSDLAFKRDLPLSWVATDENMSPPRMGKMVLMNETDEDPCDTEYR